MMKKKGILKPIRLAGSTELIQEQLQQAYLPAIVVVDAHGIVQHISEAAKPLLNVEEKTLEKALPKDLLLPVTQVLEKSVATQGPHSFENVLLRRTSKSYLLDVCIEPFPNSEELYSICFLNRLSGEEQKVKTAAQRLSQLHDELGKRDEQIAATETERDLLLARPDVHTLILDTDLRLLRMSSGVQQLINVLPTDLGRPISHFSFNFKCNDDFLSLLEGYQEPNKQASSKEYKNTEVRLHNGEELDVLIYPKYIENKLQYLVVEFRQMAEAVELKKYFRESEHTQKAILKAVPDIIFKLDRDGVLLDVISSGTSKFKLFDGKKGESIVHLVDEDTANLYKDQLEQTLSTGKIQAFNYVYGLGDKAYHHRCRMIKHGQNTVICIVRDNTERMLTEQKLEEQRFLMENITSAIPDHIYVSDLDNHDYLFTNAKENFLGYPAKTFEEGGQAFMISLIHPKDLEKESAKFLESLPNLKDGDFIESHFRLKHKDGSWRWFLTRETVFARREDGSPQQFLGVMQDITLQKEADIKVKESEARFRKLFEDSPIGVVMASVEWDIQRLNKSFREMLDIDINDFEGKTLRDLTFEDDRKLGMKKMKELLAGDIQSFNVQQRFVRKDGRHIWGNITVSCLRDEHDEPLHLIAMIEDVTDKKKQELELQNNLQELSKKNIELNKYIESNLELERFAYVASHDLKEPLRTIISFAQLLDKGYRNSLDARGQEFLNYIISGTNSMSSLIEDLLAYSRVSGSEKNFEMLDPTNVLHVVKVQIDQQIKDCNATIEVVGELPKEVKAIKSRITQLIQNLVSNGIKYREEGAQPHIKISAKDVGSHYQFTISDNGIGISKEYHDKIFHPFRKLHSRSQYDGSGIGLAICKRIVEQHNGEIWVESEPGEGSTFHFTISK